MLPPQLRQQVQSHLGRIDLIFFYCAWPFGAVFIGGIMGKIKDALPAPTACDNCNSKNIKLTTNDAVYGRQFGDWPWCYFCIDCRAAVGCHKDTNIPLGKMGDKATRQLRLKAHEVFDKIWQERLLSREGAYRWLATCLRIELPNCHMSWLDKNQLEQAIEFSNEFYKLNFDTLSQINKNELKKGKRENDNNKTNVDRRRTAEHIRRRKEKRKP